METSVENDVKQMILNVSGLPGDVDGIDENSTLDDLGFTDNMCHELARDLDDYVKMKNRNAEVNNSEIPSDMTVSSVIDLVNQKIGS